MNWNKINPNNQTLGQLISLEDWLAWFTSCTSNAINGWQQAGQFANMNTNGMPYTTWYGGVGVNTSTNTLSLVAPTYPGIWNWGSAPILLNQTLPIIIQGQVQLTPYNLLAQIITMIYRMFQNSIPYNQTVNQEWVCTWTWNFSTPYPNQTFTASQLNIPAVLSEISSYLDIYENDIIQFLILQLKYEVEGMVMLSGNTNQNKQFQETSRNFQDNGYDGNTFNPVSTNFQLNVQPMPISVSGTVNQIGGQGNNNTNGLPNGVSQTSPSSSGSPSMTSFNGGTTLNGINNLANANIHGKASATTNAQNLQYSQVNLQNFKDIGTQHINTILKPLIYKISTLFWTLGNDNYPHDDINWGFNIW